LVAGFKYRYQPIGKSFFVNAGLYPYLRLGSTSNNLSEKEAEFCFRLGGGIGWFF